MKVEIDKIEAKNTKLLQFKFMHTCRWIEALTHMKCQHIYKIVLSLPKPCLIKQPVALKMFRFCSSFVFSHDCCIPHLKAIYF